MRFDLLATPATWNVLSKTGRSYFQALVEHLPNVLGVAVAFVVESIDPRGRRVCPMASWGMDDFRGGRCYNTEGTPCERLTRGRPGLFPQGLAEQFPQDEWLKQSGMQSYVGLPLLDENGNLLGHIGVLDDRPMEDPEAVAATIESFVPRSRAELLRARQELGLGRLVGSHDWVLYRAVPPQFAADILSPNGQEFLGYSVEDLARYDDLRCRQIHDDDRQRMLTTYARAMEYGQDFIIQYRLWSKDRTTLRRFQDFGHVERDRQGRPALIVGVMLDITVQRGTDRNRESKERETLSRLEDLPGIVYRFRNDKNWSTEFIGGSSRALTGYGYDELMHDGQIGFSQLVDAADRKSVFAQRKTAFGDNSNYRVTYRLTDANGKLRHVLEMGRGISDEAGQLTCVEGLILDQSEEFTAQQALAESEEQFRAISAAAQDAVVMIDEMGEIVFWNAAAQREFGYTSEEAIGKDVHLLLAPDRYRPKASLGMRRFCRSGQGPVIGTTQRLEAMRKDGSGFPVELSVSNIQLQGRWHAVGIVRNITDREQALAEAKESEARFRALFESAADGLLIADIETQRFIAGNRRIAEQLGCEMEQITELLVSDIHPEQDLPWVLDEFKRLAAEGQGAVLDVPVKRCDGSSFIANISAFLIEFASKQCLVGAFRDVTKQKQIEAQLFEERNLLRRYLDNTPLITLVLDAGGVVTLINRHGADLLGYPVEEIVGRRWIDHFVPEAWRAGTDKAIRDCMAGSPLSRQSHESRVLTRTGEELLIDWHNTLLHNTDGSLNAVLSSGEDVTELRKMAQKLSVARERLEFIVKTVPAVLYSCEPNQELRITFVGENLGTQFGITPDDALGRSGLWLEFCHPDDLATVVEGLPNLLQTGSYMVEFRLRYDSEQRWVQNELRLARNAEGEPIEVVGYLLDITARKVAEQALRKREASLNHAQAIANLGSWETNLISGEEYWSDEVYRILGYAPRTIAATWDNMLQCIHADDLDFVRARLTHAISQETGFDIEFRAIQTNGQQRFVRARGEIVRDEQGQSASIVGTLLDFTERRRNEEKLELSREALRELAGHLQSVREDERSEIARDIHDEMGQSLAALKIDLVRLRSRLGGENPAVGNLLDSMFLSIDSAISAVQRIMSELRPSILDNLGLIAAIEWQAEQFEKRTSIVCKLDLPDLDTRLPNKVRTTLFRILQEALNNVARHANADQVDIVLNQDERWLSLLIKDDGKGISPIDVESRRSFGLLGMRERAAIFGGKVEIQSDSRQGGSQVKVWIPIHVIRKEKSDEQTPHDR